MDYIKFNKVTQELNDIKDFCKEHSHLTYDELYDRIEIRVEALQNYASKHNIPIVISLHDIVSEYCASDSLEEEYSSYYEDIDYSYYDDSYYDYEEEDSSYYDDNDN
jgi:hypothetical protein